MDATVAWCTTSAKAGAATSGESASADAAAAGVGMLGIRIADVIVTPRKKMASLCIISDRVVDG